MEHLADTSVYDRYVIELFEAPRHAGRLKDATLTGEAVSRSRGSRVRFYLRVTADTVEAAGFEALGCPHAIAAAEAVCRNLEGRRPGSLADYDAGFLDAALPLPADKRDIRILVEDAVRNAARRQES